MLRSETLLDSAVSVAGVPTRFQISMQAEYARERRKEMDTEKYKRAIDCFEKCVCAERLVHVDAMKMLIFFFLIFLSAFALQVAVAQYAPRRHMVLAGMRCHAH